MDSIRIVVKYIGSAANVASGILMATQSRNADKIISKGNKLITSSYLSRLIGKATVQSEKDKILNERTSIFDNYIANATTYGANDAAAMAHASAVKDGNKNKLKILMVRMLLSVIMLIMSGSVNAAMLTIVVAVIAGYYKKFEIGSDIITLISPSMLSSKILAIASLLLEYYNIRDKIIKYGRSVLEIIMLLF